MPESRHYNFRSIFCAVEEKLTGRELRCGAAPVAAAPVLRPGAFVKLWQKEDFRLERSGPEATLSRWPGSKMAFEESVRGELARVSVEGRLREPVRARQSVF
jgi:hypothetical protein